MSSHHIYFNCVQEQLNDNAVSVQCSPSRILEQLQNVQMFPSVQPQATYIRTVPQSQGDPKIVKRGPNFWQKGDPKGTLFDVKGDLKFEFFRIVHKEQIC